MKRFPGEAVIGLLCLICLGGCQPPFEKDKAASPVPSSTTREELTPTELTFSRLGGSGSIVASDWKGSQTLMFFFAPWTDSGAASLQWIKDFDVAGIRKIPVVVDSRPPETLAASLGNSGDGIELYTADQQVLALFESGIRALPTAVLLGESGDILQKWAGYTAITAVVTDIQSRPAIINP